MKCQYIFILCNTTYFVTFPEVAIEVPQEIIVFEICQKDKGRFFRNVRGCNIFFKGLPTLMASSLRQFWRHIQKYAFFVVRLNIQYSRNSQWEVRMTVFDEVHLQLICIVSSSPYPSPSTPFPQMSRLSPIPLCRTASKTPGVYLFQPWCVSFPQF